MANEITMTQRFALSNGLRTPSWSPASQSLDQTGTEFVDQTQTIGTGATADTAAVSVRFLIIEA